MGTTTDWTLVSLSPFGAGTMMAVAALVLIAAGVVVWSYRGAKRPFLLSLIRILGALLVIGFVVEPAIQERQVRKIKNRLAVVVDRSRSMTLEAEGGVTRYDAVKNLLAEAKGDMEKLGESHVLEYFDLDGPLSPATLAELPNGERSDLVGGLERAKEAGGGKPLAGLVLISDGADNVDLEAEQRGTLSNGAKERLTRLSVPVNTIYAGVGQAFRDVGIVDVTHDEFAFVHNTFTVDVTLAATGYQGQSVPVTLKRDGEVITSQTASFSQDGRVDVQLTSKPDKIGEYVYTVEIPSLPGEAIRDNNTRSFALSVIRDKIRVLQVAGQPSWDERFLRQHLKENPNVDLISFFILRTPTDSPGAAENELSLIPFPVDKLFTSELRSFDVVIFQNFDYRPYKMAQYLPNIRDAVLQSGLGFVMIGGPQSFYEGGYAGSDLAPILPLVPDTGALTTLSVAPELTVAGQKHPITDLSRGLGKNDAVWRGLPKWNSFNATSGAAPNATTLVVDPKIAGPGGPAPLIAVADTGAGRSMAIATDSMWRWRFAGGQSTGSDTGAAERAYHRFWSNALRWLVKDPEHSRVRVVPDKRRFDVGEPADVTFTVLGQDYQPVAGANLQVTLSAIGKPEQKLDDVTTSDNGTEKKRYQDLPEGAYRVTARATSGGKELGTGQGVFVVEQRSLELANGAPRPDLMAAIAKTTRGNNQDAVASAFDDLRLLDPDIVEVDRKKNIELWDNAWALVAGIVLLAADWAIRRRRGYL